MNATAVPRRFVLRSARHVQLAATLVLAGTFALAAPRLESRLAGPRPAALAAAIEVEEPTAWTDVLQQGSAAEAGTFRGTAHAVPAGPAYEAGFVTEALAEPAR